MKRESWAFVAAIAVRLVLLVYAEWQDANSKAQISLVSGLKMRLRLRVALQPSTSPSGGEIHGH